MEKNILTDDEILNFINILIKIKKWESNQDRIDSLKIAVKSGSWDDYLIFFIEMNHQLSIYKNNQLELESTIHDLQRLMLKS